MNEQTMIDMTREIEFLKTEVKRLASLTPLFAVKNQNLVEDVTANQNNYTLGNYDMIFLNPTANRTIRGITGGVKGRLLFIRNTSQTGSTLTFTHQDAAATAGNKITTASLGSIVLGVRQTAIFTYVSDASFTGTTLWLLLIPGA